jgi:hypothetical protein
VRPVIRKVLLPGLVILVGLAALLLAFAAGVGGDLAGAGMPTGSGIPRPVLESRDDAQLRAMRAIDNEWGRQILFGDLHVHTTFSFDAFAFSLPVIQGEGAHPPADACDFARYCAGLDFFSLNDHAELLTPRQWRETKHAIRQCNDVAGDKRSPDLVAYLGWEWTQMSPLDAQRPHYGHKNVIFRDTREDRVPTRPIGASESAPGRFTTLTGGLLTGLAAGPDLLDVKPYLDFNRTLREMGGVSRCDEAPVRELPDDCFEGAPTPKDLLRKLDDWGFPSLVIPHGTSWGIHAPPLASWRPQLATGEHDPERQRLLEVYSGHGTSEVYRDFAAAERTEDGALVCPEPRAGYEPCCWRAGELIRARCGDASEEECERRVADARRFHLEGGFSRYGTVPAATPEDWGACGQLEESFLPAYEYRPGMSAQYALAAREVDAEGRETALRFGLIGSSDNHKARGGSGYKEMGRKAMGDAWGPRQDLLERIADAADAAVEPRSPDLVPSTFGLLPERGASFYYTGGLVAVHSRGRDREAIWEALAAREVYGTSGDRILLWFDLENAVGGRASMGSEARVRGTPRFRVRAVGALEQRPGCPEYAMRALAPDRLARLCLGECYFPSDRRKRITRIEVVRIRPQRTPDEPIAPLIEDPWRSFSCDGDEAGCDLSFEDPSFSTDREHLYYVRALQEPSPAIGGDPLRCERDPDGRCIASRPCYASGPDFDPEDECLAPVEERAWSSPIWVRGSRVPPPS